MRPSPLREASATQTRFVSGRIMLVATPSYKRGIEEVGNDLKPRTIDGRKFKSVMAKALKPAHLIVRPFVFVFTQPTLNVVSDATKIAICRSHRLSSFCVHLVGSTHIWGAGTLVNTTIHIFYICSAKKVLSLVRD